MNSGYEIYQRIRGRCVGRLCSETSRTAAIQKLRSLNRKAPEGTTFLAVNVVSVQEITLEPEHPSLPTGSPELRAAELRAA
jgi:hypothetical protein